MKTLLYLVAVVMVFLLIGTAGGVETGSIGAGAFAIRTAIFGGIALASVILAKKCRRGVWIG